MNRVFQFRSFWQQNSKPWPERPDKS